MVRRTCDTQEIASTCVFFTVLFSLELQEGKAQIFPSGGPSLEKGRLYNVPLSSFGSFGS